MKKLLIVIGLLLASASTFAQIQSLLKPVDDLVFANFDRNQLIYPGDSLDMERFFSKSFLAPQVGLEPTTLRLTAECSAIELLRNVREVL